ncbi:MAG: hypothetical protein WB460_19700 [Candidatus Acidiferrales bacterium]
MIETRISVVAIAGVLFLATGVLPQEQMMKVKGGHELGESAEQFFAEGHEKEALDACATGNFKSIDKPSRRILKQYCSQLTDARQQAISGKRTEYKGDGDSTDMRTDTFTFEQDRLIKVQLLFAAPSAEENYRGQTFAQIFAGMKQAYGPPTSEHTEQVQDAFGVPYLTHRELWESPQAVLLITEQVARWPEDHGSTALTAFTRAEYDRNMTSGVQRNPSPLR